MCASTSTYVRRRTHFKDFGMSLMELCSLQEIYFTIVCLAEGLFCFVLFTIPPHAFECFAAHRLGPKTSRSFVTPSADDNGFDCAITPSTSHFPIMLIASSYNVTHTHTFLNRTSENALSGKLEEMLHTAT